MGELILHIETSTKICSVAVSDSGRQLALIEKEPDGYIHGEFLTLFIEEVMQIANRSLKDLNAVSVSIGPGSYTGLRIGLSTAKGLCFGLGIPIISIPTLDSLLTLGREQYPEANLCAMLDARRMEVYSKMIDCDDEVIHQLAAVVVDQNTFKENDPFIYFGDGAEKLSELWQDRGVIFDANLHVSALGQVQLAFEKFRNHSFTALSECNPLYLKEFGVNT